MIIKAIYSNCCDFPVAKEKEVADYPYVCPICDSNLFKFETYEKEIDFAEIVLLLEAIIYHVDDDDSYTRQKLEAIKELLELIPAE